jgi:hypothetical protein
MEAPIVKRITYFPTIVLALLTERGSYTVKGFDSSGQAVAHLSSYGSAGDAAGAVRATLHRKLDAWLDFHGVSVDLHKPPMIDAREAIERVQAMRDKQQANAERREEWDSPVEVLEDVLNVLQSLAHGFTPAQGEV